MLNSKASEKLRTMKRGDRLPYLRLTCQECEFVQTNGRRTCRRCKAPLVPRCRLCEDPVPKGRRLWCSQDCVDAYAMVTDSDWVRRQVWARDEGVCAACALDTKALANRINALEEKEARREAMRVLNENGFNCYPYSWMQNLNASLWDADHIEPLDEGGDWGLDNLQTLCHPCHKEKTAEQAARRGKQRRLLGKKWRRTQEFLRLAQGDKDGNE